MALSAAQHLELIDSAIQDILAGRVSSYSIANRSVTKLDLPKLYELRSAIQAQVTRESGGGVRLAKLGRRR